MADRLVLLRMVGVLFGAGLTVWAFRRYRDRIFRRREFLFMVLLGIGLIVISIQPGSVDVLAQMFALKNKQFGRLIALLILSNFLVWLLVLGLRHRDDRKAGQIDIVLRRLALDRFREEGGFRHVRPVTVVMPALNEAENLAVILPRMPSSVHCRALGVLVVDDGSTDDTGDVVRSSGFGAVSSLVHIGQGAALRLGYDIAAAGGAEIVITMDADGQHLPEEIEQIVAPLLDEGLDMVIGSRRLGAHERDSIIRSIGLRIFNWVINILAGARITDCSSNFRSFRIEALRAVLLRQDQYQTAEVIIDATRRGLRIGEVPITILRRHSGASKKGRNLLYGWAFSKTVLGTWLRD
jgi:hypothetical protein